MYVIAGVVPPARTHFLGDFARRGGTTPASFQVFDTLTTSKNEEGGFACSCSHSIRMGLMENFWDTPHFWRAGIKTM
jgi:hypothetical protein